MRTFEAQSPIDPCTVTEEWISAAADGEVTSVPPNDVAVHLRTCGACRAFAAAVDAGHDRSNLVTLRVAPPVAERSAAIVSKVNTDDRSAVGSVLTVLLAVLALRIAISAVGDLTGAAGTNAHAAKHLGAFGVAYAAGLLLVAVRPARARAMLPVAVVLTAAMALGAIVDVAQGRVPLSGEQSHLPELVSAVVLWMIARRQSQMRESAARSHEES